jgi:tetratricopeptide (TPR) repeat protein
MGWVVLAGCLLGMQCARQSEVPITTASKEARELFKEARMEGENLYRAVAMTMLSDAIEKDPDFAMAYLYRSHHASDPERRLRDLQRAVELSDGVSAGEQMIIKSYQAYYSENNPDRAVEFYELLTDMFPRDKRVHFRLGEFYRLMGRNEMAVEQQERALSIDENFPPSYNQLGYINLAMGNYTESEESFQNYIRLVPEQPNPYDSMGDLYSRMGRYEEAIEYYKQALEKDPDFTYSQLKIGTNLVFLGRYGEGREAGRKAIQLQPTVEGQVQDMGLIYRSYLYEGEPQKALEEADKIIKIASENNMMSQVAQYELAKAAIYVEQEDYDEAEQSLRECRTILETAEMPSFFWENFSDMLHFWEAAAAAKQKNITQALATAARYMNTLRESRNPDRMKYHMGLLGYIELERDFPEIAVEYFRQADIEEPLFMYYAALAEYQGGSRARAARLFRRLADWNADSLWYAYIYKKALARQE